MVTRLSTGNDSPSTGDKSAKKSPRIDYDQRNFITASEANIPVFLGKSPAERPEIQSVIPNA
jgi:hypothetical protein